MPLAVMTIRNIDDAIEARLRIRAATHGRSMEDDSRDLLRSALSTEIPRPRDPDPRAFVGRVVHTVSG